MKRKLLKASEYARLTQISTRTVYRLYHQGLIKGYQIGRSIRFAEPEATVKVRTE